MGLHCVRSYYSRGKVIFHSVFGLPYLWKFPLFERQGFCIIGHIINTSFQYSQVKLLPVPGR